ncbi:MAG: 23S rRNA (uracil-5-)-methyltransferase RumA, partial [Lachnospiraceae bacterium]|nr:23S rRNA (uracil-5-)-methyltransferase RumA [Lachnospiraceae bacterium]
MKKGTVLEGIVNKIQFPNKGIVEVDGEKAIVKNALPGQNVRFVVNKSRKGKGEGRLLEVLERSTREWDKESWKEQVCPHFEICGGCLYQSLPYEEQLKIKEEQVKELIDSVCANPEYEFQGIKASPLYQGYRNKMEFSFGDEYKGGPLSLGMHKRGSFYDIVSTPECRIVHPDFRRLLVATKEYFSQKGIDFYKKLAHTGYLRHLLVRRAVKTGEILVVLVTSSQMDKGETELLEGWKEGILSLPLEGTLSGILHTVNDSLAD